MAVTRITSSPARPRTTTRRALGVEGARLFDELPGATRGRRREPTAAACPSAFTWEAAGTRRTHRSLYRDVGAVHRTIEVGASYFGL